MICQLYILIASGPEELTHFRNIQAMVMDSTGTQCAHTHLLIGFKEQHLHFIQNQVAESKKQQASVREKSQEAVWSCDNHITYI